MASTPAERVRRLNQAPINTRGDYVLYWMTAARRTRHNFGLQRAAELGRELGRPLMVLEALRLDHPHACARFHAFIMQGMADNLRALAAGPAFYFPYVEPAPGAGKGLLAALAARACAVVADDFPAFFLPRMLAAAARQAPVRLEAVDSCGLMPLAATPGAFSSAHQMRRFLHRELPARLGALAQADALADPLAQGLPAWPRGKRPPAAVAERWPAAGLDDLARPGRLLASLAGQGLDQGVGLSPLVGGSVAAAARLAAFVAQGLDRYEGEARQPLAGAASGLSPYLHFGHIAAQEVFLAVARAEGWAPHRLNPGAAGRRQGFWGVSPSAEAFLDQLVTWRELGYHFCRHQPGHEGYESLPAWSRRTLEAHAGDPRPYLYTPAELEAAATHDPIWNAAQRQLRREGVMPNYLRMLWGKNILQWSPGPRQALEYMLTLNNRLALDGRDPNSVSGVFWCLGRFDRPWGPARPILGNVRCLTSQATTRKLRLAEYLARYGPEPGEGAP